MQYFDFWIRAARWSVEGGRHYSALSPSEMMTELAWPGTGEKRKGRFYFYSSSSSFFVITRRKIMRLFTFNRRSPRGEIIFIIFPFFYIIRSHTAVRVLLYYRRVSLKRYRPCAARTPERACTCTTTTIGENVLLNSRSNDAGKEKANDQRGAAALQQEPGCCNHCGARYSAGTAV